jgi:hypothetical protein
MIAALAERGRLQKGTVFFMILVLRTKNHNGHWASLYLFFELGTSIQDYGGP